MSMVNLYHCRIEYNSVEACRDGDHAVALFIRDVRERIKRGILDSTGRISEALLSVKKYYATHKKWTIHFVSRNCTPEDVR